MKKVIIIFLLLLSVIACLRAQEEIKKLLPSKITTTYHNYTTIRTLEYDKENSLVKMNYSHNNNKHPDHINYTEKYKYNTNGDLLSIYRIDNTSQQESLFEIEYERDSVSLIYLNDYIVYVINEDNFPIKKINYPYKSYAENETLYVYNQNVDTIKAYSTTQTSMGEHIIEYRYFYNKLKGCFYDAVISPWLQDFLFEKQLSKNRLESSEKNLLKIPEVSRGVWLRENHTTTYDYSKINKEGYPIEIISTNNFNKVVYTIDYIEAE